MKCPVCFVRNGDVTAGNKALLTERLEPRVTAQYDAVVYDLDGTLTRLRVDWETVRDEVAAKLQARGMTVEDKTLWELFELPDEEPLRQVVTGTIAEHEREGARQSQRLPLAGELPQTVPVGVCSLNAEAACRIALELHGLDAHVDAIVGRDTVDRYKPDPAPLLYTFDQLGERPEKSLFIGDSRRDAVTADRAGVDFQYVDERIG